MIDTNERMQKIIHDTAHRFAKLYNNLDAMRAEINITMQQVLLDMQELESLKTMVCKIKTLTTGGD